MLNEDRIGPRFHWIVENNHCYDLNSHNCWFFRRLDDARDKFHLAKNLTEAIQLLLARCQSEVFAASHTEETGQSELNKSKRELRPLESGHVKKARLARREGRLARYQEVKKLYQQGFKPKEIAQRLSLGDRTIQKVDVFSDAFRYASGTSVVPSKAAEE